MIDWISGGRYRLLVVLSFYFSLHVAIRWWLSGSLSFDESEQAFLSQWGSLGYNSQPPLYTWVQTGLFELLGYSVVPLAMLKNGILLATYLMVFGFLYHATGDKILALIASLGMLTMPQISWESHRDLSHTVSVTFAAAFLLYSVVRVVRDGTNLWYVSVGVATGLGIMSKYNFLFVLLAVLVASATLPNYRQRLLDRRILISVVVAAAMIGPHMIWMLDHPSIASSKTVSQLISEVPISWAQRVARGGVDLVVSTVGCSIVTLIAFGVCFGREFSAVWRSWRRGTVSPSDRVEAVIETRHLVERLLLCIALALICLVASGNAIHIKNHWLQPFLFLLPAYLALLIAGKATIRHRPANQFGLLCSFAAIAVVVATVGKPLTAAARGRYTRLNMPYPALADALKTRIGDQPQAIFAANTRVAGNLRLQFPATAVLAQDHNHLDLALPGDLEKSNLALRNGLAREHTLAGPPSFATGRGATRPVIAITDSLSEDHRRELAEFVSDRLQLRRSVNLRWQTVSLPYLYGRAGDHKDFYYAIIGIDQTDPRSPDASTEPAGVIANRASKVDAQKH